ncbi:L-type lectin-domain containing protein [Winogradskya humida]|uniref:Legume-like lectin family protein n=1 Tax=Winogradskya humida TaxID=113566 RepID=A0ABQ3ZVH0_9ACTN|nr:L-type lectin-domain containing protein [Actinoplanes humidus]GIE22611.1 hypothetical protein Ahu01nite_057130 [Actinoplanes humidus]
MRNTLARCAAAAATAVLAATAMPAAAAQAAPSGSITKAANLHLLGSATVEGKTIRLTSDTKRQAGAAWYKSKLNPKRSFETAFTVTMTGEVGHADGVALVLQNDGPKAYGGHGGSLGYGGMTHSVAVELDTFKNPLDVDNNHIAIVAGGLSDAAQPMSASSPIMMFGQTLRVRITYLAETKTLKVRLRAAGSTTEIKVLQETIDLAQALGNKKAFIGFTGGTGEDVSVQEISNWVVKLKP